jgi:hypothetical protein
VGVGEHVLELVTLLMPLVGMKTYPFTTVGRGNFEFVKALKFAGVQLVESLHQSVCKLLAS